MRRRYCLLLNVMLLLLAIPGQVPAQTAESPFSSARKLLEKGKYDDAIAELQTLAKQDPAPQGIAHELGMAFYRKGDYVNALANFQQATKANPADLEAVQLTGLSLYLGGNPAEAIPYLERVQTWYPRANVDASYILGTAYLQAKKYPEARRAFAKMFSLPADSAAAYLLCARMLLRFDFGPIAEEYGMKAVALDPKLPLAHYLLGELYLYQSKIPEAIAQLEQELALNPANANVYYKLGDAYSRDQKFDEAERLLQRSIWLDATSTGPFILLGKVLEKKGEPELALRALQHAITMDPNNGIPHYLLGQVFRDLGRAEDASREFKAAEQLQTRDAAKP